jgi:hypothetical protein
MFTVRLNQRIGYSYLIGIIGRQEWGKDGDKHYHQQDCEPDRYRPSREEYPPQSPPFADAGWRNGEINIDDSSTFHKLNPDRMGISPIFCSHIEAMGAAD